MNRDISINVDNNKLNVRVIFLVENNGRYLLETSPVEGVYNVLGGRMQFNETSIVAVLREIKEELGLSLAEKDIKLIATVESLFDFMGYAYHEFCFAYYLNLDNSYKICNEEKIINLDKPEQEFFWVKKEDLHNYRILSPFFDELDPTTYKHIIADHL